MKVFALATVVMLSTATAGDRSEVRLENEHVRVVENLYQPGEASPLHAHEHPRVVYVPGGGEMELVAEDGSSALIRIEAGQTTWRPPETHLVRNVGLTTVPIMETEVKARPQR